jgi:hypothetical protein
MEAGMPLDRATHRLPSPGAARAVLRAYRDPDDDEDFEDEDDEEEDDGYGEPPPQDDARPSAS